MYILIYILYMRNSNIMYIQIKVLYFILLLTLLSNSLYSQDAKKLDKRGIKYGELERYDDAVKTFDKAIEVYNKNSSKTFHNKAWVLELKGEFDKAILNYEEAIRRNSDQLPSYERVGYLYYKTGRYEKAVKTGEYVLNKDLNNREVVKWLPDAYRLRLKKRQEELLAKKQEEERKRKEELQKKKEEEKALIARKENEEGEEDEDKPPRLIYATFDFMIRTGYYFSGDKGYKYITTPGYYSNFPEMLYINCTPKKEYEFDLLMGNPYLGALSPNLVIHTEILQGIYHLGKYSLGIGVMGNHYRSSFNFGKLKSLSDYKIGIVFGIKEEKYNINLSFYPRFIPRDGESSSNKTLDVDKVKIKIDYFIDKVISYYLNISILDYYFFDHDTEVSNYWGIYDIGFGLILGRFDDDKKYLTLTFDLTERFYMRNLNNEKPYSYINGQGWFGADADNWFKGDPFSGYRSSSHVLTVKGEERINDYLFIYQKIIYEMVDRGEDHDEICFVFGVGGIY